MRVRELSCYAVEIPTPHDRYVMSHGRVLDSFPSTVVKVTADDGTVGYGEACTLGMNYLDGFPASARETVRLLADWVFTCDPFEPGVLVDGMDDRLVGNLTGKAAIDIAMWDLRGRLLGRPVAQLLGGVKQSTRSPRSRRSASRSRRPWPGPRVGRPTRATARGSSSSVTTRCTDAARAHAVAAAVPPGYVCMTCDANKGWTVAQALRFAHAVQGLDTYLEQPCRSLARARPGPVGSPARR